MLPQQAPGILIAATDRPDWFRTVCDGLFSKGCRALHTKIFVKLAGGQNEQKLFANGLRAFAFGTIKLAGCEFAELLLHKTSNAGNDF
jgi:hypothetical protein